MTEHRNAARFRELAAAESGFIEGIADDIEWWEIGASEPIVGKQALGERMAQFGDYGITPELHDVVANDDHVIALMNVTATKDKETLRYRTAEIYHVNSEGQVTQRWAFSDDTQAIIDFFS